MGVSSRHDWRRVGHGDPVVSSSRLLLSWRMAFMVVLQVFGLLLAVGFAAVGNRCGLWGGSVYLVVMSPVLAATLAALARASAPTRRSTDGEILSIRWSPLVSFLLGLAWVAAYVAFVPAGPFFMYKLPTCGTGVQGLVVLEGFVAVAFVGLLTTTPALLRVLRGRVRRPGVDLSRDGIDVHGVFRTQHVGWSRARPVSVDRPAARSLYGGFKVNGAAHLKITRGANEPPVLVLAWPFGLRAEDLVAAVESERDRWAPARGKRRRREE